MTKPTEQEWQELEEIAQFLGYKNLQDFLIHGMQEIGAHHKQWYLEQMAKAVGVDLDVVDYEPGIAP